MELEWKRARKSPTGNRVWESKCERYRVAASEMCFGVKIRPITYRALVKDRIKDVNGWVVIWKILSSHKKREKAIEACDLYERKRRE